MTSSFKCKKAAVFHNTGRKTLQEIQEKTGATHLVNGYFFNNKIGDKDYFKPNGWLVIDGEVISKSTFNDWGLGIDKDGKPVMTTDRSGTFLDGVPILKDGKRLERNLTPDVKAPSDRTAIGWTKAGQILLLCKKRDMTREELQDELLEMGCVDALMMDGGGSTQGIFPGGELKSSRKVATVILFWEEENMSKKVCLDAGHDAGNKANASPDGRFYEHEFALDMAKRMGAILKVHGVEVTYTRKGGEEVSLAERCKIANNVKDLDLFVSLHSNAAATTGWNSARGWEAYVFTLKGNGYKAAEAIEKRVRARGTQMRIPAIKTNSLYVIRNTKAPAVLIEHGFHTNTLDVKLMESAAWRQSMAQAQAFGILDYLGIEPMETDKKEWTEQELAVEWITKKGLMKGDNGDLMLDKPLTREQFAVMLYRFAKQKGMEG